jgi:polyhydroxybutyrate depolymerase
MNHFSGITAFFRLGLLLCCAALPATTTHGAPPADLEPFTLTRDGRVRTYSVHYPSNRPPAAPKPVVFALHGGGGADAEEMARRTGLNRIADREDFLVVYPQGVDGQWNDGRGKTFRRAVDNRDVDDVKFISDVIDELVGKKQADPSRVYVMGLSNGGMMTYRLGIELGHRLAAIASVIANLPENIAAQKPARPLPVLIMNGTDDPMMPWNGGPVTVLGKTYGTVLSTDRTVRYWVEAAQLPPKPTTRVLKDRSPDDRCTVEVVEYSAPNHPVEVVLYRIRGGGHNLPGANTPDRPRLLGRKCEDIVGMEVIWSFFQKHTLPKTAPTGPAAASKPPAAWRPNVKPVGDPQANYLNVEFTCDGRYMVWIEGVGGRAADGIVWHCGVDPASGDLIPPDGRGFRAFESTSWARANPGCDKHGPYYVGADRTGRLIMVRPDGPTRGQVTRLPPAPDPRRRAIYPTCLPHRAGGFVFFIQNQTTAGAGVRANNNAWVELQYLNLANPAAVIPIERQDTPPVGFAPMDVGFARWMRGRPLLTYGARSAQTGNVEIRAFDADQPTRKPSDLTASGHNCIDPYPAVIGEQEYILTGTDATATTRIYRRPAGRAADAPFDLFRTLAPDRSQLAAPSLAQSHEPFLFRGRLYTVYQVNERGTGFFDMTFRKPGEIWLADLSADPVQQWLIAPDEAGPVAEPEPLIAAGRVWIFYNRPLTEEAPARTGRRAFPRLALYRAEVPLNTSP